MKSFMSRHTYETTVSILQPATTIFAATSSTGSSITLTTLSLIDRPLRDLCAFYQSPPRGWLRSPVRTLQVDRRLAEAIQRHEDTLGLAELNIQHVVQLLRCHPTCRRHAVRDRR